MQKKLPLSVDFSCTSSKRSSPKTLNVPLHSEA